MQEDKPQPRQELPASTMKVDLKAPSLSIMMPISGAHTPKSAVAEIIVAPNDKS